MTILIIPCYVFGSLFSWHVGIRHGVVVSFLGLRVLYSINFVEPIMSIFLGIIIYTYNSYRYLRQKDLTRVNDK